MDQGRTDGRVARTVATAALVVVVLGVLPIAWGVSAVWQVAGCAVAVLFAAHAARVIWREAFSTSG